MLSPALLKDSISRRSSFVGSYHADENQNFYGRKRSDGSRGSEEEPRGSEGRRPSLYLITESEALVRRGSSGSQKKKERRKISVEQNMFSNSTNFFGTSSILSQQSSFRDNERHRAKQLSMRKESVAVGPKANITPHQYTSDPTLAWEMLKEKRPVKPVRQMKLDTPVKPDHIRFVCIGCTHGLKIDPSRVPPGDVLLVAGDFTSCGLPKEVQYFNKSLGKGAFLLAIFSLHLSTSHK
ncbi:hypothetical protein RB195_020345 [Necator americanus]|uniref:Uncharacterized protein n=1 Tax=Necator americanus TaxID=51031 RepID=A0ABR1CIT3_NECAM